MTPANGTNQARVSDVYDIVAHPKFINGVSILATLVWRLSACSALAECVFG